MTLGTNPLIEDPMRPATEELALASWGHTELQVLAELPGEPDFTLPQCNW